MNYYFIYGPKMEDVVINYTDLTGKPQHLPPLWALGFHQCKWSYYPESNVKEITKKFRDLKIPLDAVVEPIVIPSIVHWVFFLTRPSIGFFNAI
mgnify:CR=1 FL=1